MRIRPCRRLARRLTRKEILEDATNHLLKPKQYLLVAVIFLAASVPFLGSPALFDPDEGYYPASAREMVERGSWIDPVFNGRPRWGKSGKGAVYGAVYPA